MTGINRQKFLAELGQLLSFMYEEDRQYALEMYERMFDIAEDDEQGLIQHLMSPTRQAVIIARAYDTKARSLTVATRSKDEDDVEEEEGTPPFVLAINRIFDELFPEEAEEEQPQEDQVSFFDLGVADSAEVQKKPKMPRAATLLSDTQEFEAVTFPVEDTELSEAEEEPDSDLEPESSVEDQEQSENQDREEENTVQEAVPEEKPEQSAEQEDPEGDLVGRADEIIAAFLAEAEKDRQAEQDETLTEETAAETESEADPQTEEPAEDGADVEETAEDTTEDTTLTENQPAGGEVPAEQPEKPETASKERTELAEVHEEAPAEQEESVEEPAEAPAEAPVKAKGLKRFGRKQKAAAETEHPAAPEVQHPAEVKEIPEVPERTDPEEESPSKPVVYEKKSSVPLLILFLVAAIPVTLAGLLALAVPTVICLGLAVGLIALGAVLVVAAFSGFAVLADILLLLGAAIVVLALGLLMLWIGLWLIGGAMVGLVRAVKELCVKWCWKEVPAA